MPCIYSTLLLCSSFFFPICLFYHPGGITKLFYLRADKESQMQIEKGHVPIANVFVESTPRGLRDNAQNIIN